MHPGACAHVARGQRCIRRRAAQHDPPLVQSIDSDMAQQQVLDRASLVAHQALASAEAARVARPTTTAAAATAATEATPASRAASWPLSGPAVLRHVVG